MSAFEDPLTARPISSWENRFPVLYALRDRFVKGALLVVVLVAAGLLFLVLRGPDRRSFTFGPSSPRVQDVGSWAVISGVPSWWGGSPPAVAREADRLAASDPVVARLLRLGDGKRFGNVGGSKAVGKGTAWLAYKLKRPIAVDTDLPYIVVPPDAPSHGTCVSPYAAGWAHLQATGVTALWVVVDLGRHEVVQISVNAERGRVSPVAGKSYPSCNEDQTG